MLKSYSYYRQFKPKYEWRPRVDSNHSLSEGLVGLWLFNEGSGLTVYDIGSVGNYGILTNGAYWTHGKTGIGVGLDGIDDYVKVPHHAEIDLVEKWTLLAVCKRAAINTQHSLVEKYNWASGYGGYLIRVSNANYAVAGHVSNTAWDSVTGGTVINANTWYQIAGTFNSNTTTLIIYVNGKQDGINTTASLTPLSSTVTLKIGARGDNYATVFNGIIDHVRIYNRALSPQEILWLYEEPFAGIIYDTIRKFWFMSVEAPSAFKPFWSHNTNVLIQGSQL